MTGTLIDGKYVGPIYVGFIFEPRAEGIEGATIVSTDREYLKSQIETEVNRENKDFRLDDESFSWNGGDFFPSKDLAYGSFYWGRIYDSYNDTKFRFSEFGG